MTVEELINSLSILDSKLEVFLSTDEEGNGFALLYSANLSSMRDGEAVHPDDAVESDVQVVVLWP